MPIHTSPLYETKTAHGIFTKSSDLLLLVQPHARYDYCNQQFRIHRNSYLCHLILWQSVRQRGVPLYPRKIFTALPILQKFGGFVSIRELQTNRFNHRKNPCHETVKCFGTVAILYHKKTYLRKTSCKIPKDML